MLHPSDPELRRPLAVRDGQSAPGHLRRLWLSPGRHRRGLVPLQPARRARRPRLPGRLRRRRARHHRPRDLASPSERRRPRRSSGRVRPPRLVHDDPIAHAADGDDLRAAGRLDLGPQAGEVRLQPEQVRIGLGRPAGAGQLQVRDDVAVGADERLEQAELGRRQGQRRRRRPGPRGGRAPGPEPPASSGPAGRAARRPGRSTRRMTAAIRASSSALPNGLVR